MKTEITEIQNLEALKAFAQRLSQRLSDRHVLLLNGTVGAGKTQLTRFLLEQYGSDEAVSPSFAIHNQYSSSRGPIDHVDLYRLEDEDDLESSGFWDLFAAAKGLIIIEWAERLPANSISKNWKQTSLDLEITGETSRRIIERSSN